MSGRKLVVHLSQKRNILSFFYAFVFLIIVSVTYYFFINYGWISLGIYIFFLIIIGWNVFYTFLYTKLFRIELDSNSLEYAHGVFDRTTETVEMQRIQDYVKNQGIVEQILGIATVIIHSTDKTTPEIVFSGVTLSDAKKIIKFLQYESSDSLVKHISRSGNQMKNVNELSKMQDYIKKKKNENEKKNNVKQVVIREP